MISSVVTCPVAADELIDEMAGVRMSAGDRAGEIRRVQGAIDEALAVGNLWLGTCAIVQRANVLQVAGDYPQAARLAAVAATEATMALNRHQLEKARYLYRKL